ncbi:MAG: nucleotidyltransferase domain-containing protein, partial [Microcystis sp. M53603_WE2]
MKRDEVLTILAKHREQLEKLGVKSLSLFGSVARDEARFDSDVDLLVEFSKAVGLFEFI